MNLRHFASLWLLLAGACAFEPGGENNFAPEVGDNTSNGATTAVAGSTGDTSGPSGSSTTSPVAESSGDGSSSATTDGTTGTLGPTSSSGGEPTCGDGVPEGEEACDDGNDDEFDGCTSQCTIPTCDDGEANGDETDVDCGGTCEACALCQTCVAGPDCADPMVCGADGQCVTRFEMAVDWVTHCGSQAQGVTISALAAGTYRATAVESAGTRWLPPPTPPTTGYYYDTACTGVSFEQMRTAKGQRYIDISTSFANMISETELFDHAGGDFTCWAEDDGCGDNNGSVEFSFEYVCE